jgi:hypothetical protein
MLVLPTALLPTDGSDFTVEFWMNLTADSRTDLMTLFAITDDKANVNIASAAYVLFRCYATMATGGSLFLEASDRSGVGGLFVDPVTGLGDSTFHHVVVRRRADNTTFDLYVDGALAYTQQSQSVVDFSPTSVSIKGAVSFSMAGTANHSAVERPLHGSLAHFACYVGLLSPARIAAHYNAGVTAFAGEDSGARITRLLRYAAWGETTVIDAGSSTLRGADDISGQSALEAILAVNDTEGGDLFAAPDGPVTFRNRHSRLAQTAPKVIFGTDVAGGEIPFQDDDLQIDDGPEYIYNVVLRSRQGGINFAAQDGASTLDYFPGSSALEMLSDNDGDVIDAANFVLATHKDAHDRVSSLTIRPSHHPAAWPAALSLQQGDRVQVNVRVPGYPTYVFDGFIEHVQHTKGQSFDDPDTTLHWAVTYQMSPLVFGSYWLVAALRTTLKTTAAAGATTLALNLLADSATNPAEANLRPGTRLTIDPAGAGAETVAVTSVATAGSQINVGVRAPTGAATTLTAATQLTSPTIAVTANCPAAAAFALIDGEILTITGGQGTKIVTVTGGAFGTIRSPHLNGAAVKWLASTGTVRVHNAGVTVCEPLPAGVTDPTTYDAVAALDSTARLAW